MDIKPEVMSLMKRDAYSWIVVSIVAVLAFIILQLLVVGLDEETSTETFVQYVWPWVIGTVVALWAIWPWFAYLWFTNLSYSIGEERLIIRKGILNKKEVSIPYRAVTDFTLRRGFFEGMLGIGAILVQTAGQSAQSGFEAKLEGLPNYAELHSQLRARLQLHQGEMNATTVSASMAESDLSGNQILLSILEEMKGLREDLQNR